MTCLPMQPLIADAERRMRRYALAATLGILSLCGYQAALAANGFCGPLRKFVESVKQGETRVIKFHTMWGSNFKGSNDPAMIAKRCDRYGYEPAKGVCSYLLTYGATEFAGINAKEAVVCLSPKTQVAPGTRLHDLSLSITYGTENRGENVDIVFSQDQELGGMVLSISVQGY